MEYYEKEEKSIRVYNTHIEIFPYKLGEYERLEKELSLWIEEEYRYEPIGYMVIDDTLYIPRGYNTKKLEIVFNSTAFFIKLPDDYDIFSAEITTNPRDRIQEESIDFLTGTGKFKKAILYSQQALILQTGLGKTYTAINSIVNMGMKAVIITHQDKIKNQWIDSFLKYTDIPENKLINISGSNIIDRIFDSNDYIGDIYFVNHQTLASYAKDVGWDKIRKFFKHIKAGIKIFDEAHLEFRNILRIDMFSNTLKTIYLTANFDRSDPKESRLFSKCFSNTYKFGEETKEYEENRRHIIYVPVLYRSNPSVTDLQMANNAYGFSVIGFSKYALHVDDEKTMLRTFLSIFDLAIQIEGKILITVNKIDDTEYIKEIIEKEYIDLGKSISTINSRNTKADNEKAKECDIICSTIKSCGTGVDIKGLRVIINMEPFSSNITANQLSGRLREYAPDKDTYFFDLIDISFPTCENQYKAKLKFLKKKCKEIRVFKK